MVVVNFATLLYNHSLNPKVFLTKNSCPYIPEQNGIVEGKHRHIVETTISLIFIHLFLLNFCLMPSLLKFFLINRMFSPSLQMLSSFEMFFHNTSDLHHLKFFGYTCYPLLKPYTKHKLEPKTTQHIFLGYPHNFKGYIYYNPLTK